MKIRMACLAWPIPQTLSAELQGIAGESLQEIEGLELPALGIDATEGI